MIHYTCQHCGRSREVAEEHGGRRARCPCGHLGRVPMIIRPIPPAGAVRPLPRAQAVEPEPVVPDFLAGLARERRAADCTRKRRRTETRDRGCLLMAAGFLLPIPLAILAIGFPPLALAMPLFGLLFLAGFILWVVGLCD